jgi:hypothetical protein
LKIPILKGGITMKKSGRIRKVAKLIWITLLALLNPWSTKNIGIASRWGKLEHRFGRLTGLAILVSFGVAYLRAKYSWEFLSYPELFCISTSFVFWAVYLIAHTLEKEMYGPGLRASTKAGL